MGLASFGGHATSGGGGGGTTTVSGKQIGEMVLVPNNFSSADFLDSGSTVDNATYPTLYASISSAFSGEGWTTTNTPSIPTAICSAIHGTVIDCIMADGVMFAITSKGYVFSIGNDHSTITYITRLERCIKNGAIVYAVMVSFGKIFVTFTSSNIMARYDSSSFSTYTAVTLPSTSSFTFKTANGIMFGMSSVAAGSVIKSIDQGLNWSTQALPTTASYTVRGVDFYNGVYCAVTTGTSTNNMATSTDAISWTVRSGPGTGAAGIVVSSVGFVIIPSSSNATPYTSTDGISWTPRSVNITGTVNRITIASNGTTLLASYAPSVGAGTAHVSTDGGITWVSRNANVLLTYQNTMHAHCITNDEIVSFGCHSTSTTGQIVFGYSSNNLSTTPSFIGMNSSLNKNTLSYGDFTNSGLGVMIETTASDAGLYTVSDLYGVFTTNGGASWTQTTLPNSTNTVLKIVGCYGTGDGINVVCAGGKLYRTTDGSNWSIITSSMISTSATPYGTNNSKLFSASGSSINVSLDYGASYPTYALPVALTAQSSVKAYGSYIFLVSPNSTTVYFSADDGASWSTISNGMPLNSTGYPGQLAGGNRGIFMSCPLGSSTGSSSIYLVSFDGGQNWNQRSFPNAVTVYAATYSNGTYYVFIGGSSYMYSTDLVTWVLSGANDAKLWKRIIFDNTGLPFIIGAPDNTYLIKGSVSKKIPTFNSPYPGSKWVVKAK